MSWHSKDILEQVSQFDYQGHDISFEYDKNITANYINFSQYVQLLEILKGKLRNETRIRYFRSLAIPIVLYRSETWVLRKGNKSSIQSAEMAFLC